MSRKLDIIVGIFYVDMFYNVESNILAFVRCFLNTVHYIGPHQYCGERALPNF